MDKSVSVILCTYNGETYLPLQLKTITEQTVHPKELIIQDDGSTDNTLAIAEAFAREAPFPTRVIRNPVNLGFADNFLAAAEKAQSTHLAFCDQDDVWLPTKIETCLKAFSHPEVKVVIHSAKLISGDGEPMGGRYPAYQGRTIKDLRMSPWEAPPGFAMMCTRDLVTEFDWHHRPVAHLDPKRGPKPHDQWLFFLGTAIGEVVLLQDDLALYRQHGSNAAGAPVTTFGGQFKDAAAAGAAVYREKAGFAKEYGDYMQEIAPRHPRYTAALQRASGFYLRASDLERRRAALYEGSGIAAKFRLLSKNLLSGDYGSRLSGRLGVKSLAKDAAKVFV